MVEEKIKPVFKSSCGGVEASVWAQQTENGVMHSITSHRNYKNKDNEWAKTQSLKVQDIANMKYVLDECFRYIKVTSKEEARAKNN